MQGGDAREIAAAVLAADWDRSTRSSDLLLDGLALLTCEGYVGGRPALKVALRAFRDESLSEEEELRWLWLACRVARALADDEAWDELTARHSSLHAGPAPSCAAGRAHRTRARRAVLREDRDGYVAGRRVGRRRRGHRQSRDAAHVDRAGELAGRDAEAVALIEARRQDVLRRGEGLWLAANDWGGAIRYNGLGRYEDALDPAGGPPKPHAARAVDLLLAELIEAAHAAARPSARRSACPLAEKAPAAGTDWALGNYARAPACWPGGAASGSTGGSTGYRASGRRDASRAHADGEWLRREHRRVDAREQLRVAYTMLSDMGMEALPSAPTASSWPPVRRYASARRDARRADPDGGAGRGLAAADRRTRRSPPSCSEPPHGGVASGRRYSESSASARARSSARRCPTSGRPSAAP